MCITFLNLRTIVLEHKLGFNTFKFEIGPGVSKLEMKKKPFTKQTL